MENHDSNDKRSDIDSLDSSVFLENASKDHVTTDTEQTVSERKSSIESTETDSSLEHVSSINHVTTDTEQTVSERMCCIGSKMKVAPFEFSEETFENEKNKLDSFLKDEILEKTKPKEVRLLSLSSSLSVY